MALILYLLYATAIEIAQYFYLEVKLDFPIWPFTMDTEKRALYALFTILATHLPLLCCEELRTCCCTTLKNWVVGLVYAMLCVEWRAKKLHDCAADCNPLAVVVSGSFFFPDFLAFSGDERRFPRKSIRWDIPHPGQEIHHFKAEYKSIRRSCVRFF